MMGSVYQVAELYALDVPPVICLRPMADEGPISSDKLKQVLDRLDDVLDEAARLRKEVIRQLGEQRAGQQQHLSGSRRRTSRTPRSRKH